jgi:serine/threonine-protein kinase RsbW
MTAPAPLRLDLPSMPQLLPIVRSALRSLVDALPQVRLDDDEVAEVAVALQEACTNAIRHAHGLDPSKRFQVEFCAGDEALEVLVIDHGEPFALGSADTPDPELLQEGGYGMGIMHAWMDEVELHRVDDSNVLRMVRRYRVAEDSGRADHAITC